ncbi:MAG TPA: hypothetical protein VFQ43_15395, partial [Nitrososphaera sp.]|nr:hypothetical protein [Nitrososphaera sp.]
TTPSSASSTSRQSTPALPTRLSRAQEAILRKRRFDPDHAQNSVEVEVVEDNAIIGPTARKKGKKPADVASSIAQSLDTFSSTFASSVTAPLPPQGSSEVQAAVKDFRDNFSAGLSPDAKLRVIRLLGANQGMEAVLWSSMDQETKAFWVEESSKAP